MAAATLDVVGIGNAIVDVLAHADDGFLDRHGLAKGTMTLIGCGMLWLMLVLLVLSRWYPALLAVIVLMLTLFLSLQLLRLIVRK